MRSLASQDDSKITKLLRQHVTAVVQAMMNRHDANNNQNMSLDEFIRM
jgi:hypothetical protein